MPEQSLAPGLLVAAPTMPDPRFAGAVILLAEATSEGALGFILNQPTNLTCGDVGVELGVDVVEGLSHKAVFNGGPVSPERGWVLFRDPGIHHEGESLDSEAGSIFTLSEGIQLGATLDLLREFFSLRDRRPFRFLLGCSGWSCGQLEIELSEGSWLPIELTDDLLFEVEPEDLWDTAVRRLGLLPGAFTTTGGGVA